MKKEYTSPAVEVHKLEYQGVIADSGPTIGGDTGIVGGDEDDEYDYGGGKPTNPSAPGTEGVFD